MKTEILNNRYITLLGYPPIRPSEFLSGCEQVFIKTYEDVRIGPPMTIFINCDNTSLIAYLRFFDDASKEELLKYMREVCITAKAKQCIIFCETWSLTVDKTDLKTMARIRKYGPEGEEGRQKSVVAHIETFTSPMDVIKFDVVETKTTRRLVNRTVLKASNKVKSEYNMNIYNGQA